jgi:ribosomal protein L37E
VAHDWPIDRDVACTKCGFNVRTLAVTSRCTECGFPVLRSFVGHEADVKRGAPVDADKVTRTALLVLSRLLKRNRDALGFILLAYRHAA